MSEEHRFGRFMLEKTHVWAPVFFWTCWFIGLVFVGVQGDLQHRIVTAAAVATAITAATGALAVAFWIFLKWFFRN